MTPPCTNFLPAQVKVKQETDNRFGFSGETRAAKFGDVVKTSSYVIEAKKGRLSAGGLPEVKKRINGRETTIFDWVKRSCGVHPVDKILVQVSSDELTIAAGMVLNVPARGSCLVLGISRVFKQGMLVIMLSNIHLETESSKFFTTCSLDSLSSLLELFAVRHAQLISDLAATTVTVNAEDTDLALNDQ